MPTVAEITQKLADENPGKPLTTTQFTEAYNQASGLPANEAENQARLQEFMTARQNIRKVQAGSAPKPEAPAAPITPSPEPQKPEAPKVEQPKEPEINVADEYKKQLDGLNAESALQYDSSIGQLATLQANMDARTAALIENLKATYERRKEDMAKINTAVVANTNTAELRSGRARFASTISQGNIASEERAGIQRIADLDNELTGLILQAQDANDEKKLKALNETTKLIKEKRDEQRQAILDQITISRNAEQDAIAKAQEARQQEAADIASQKATMERNVEISKNIASSVLNSLTGDPIKDIETIKQVADLHNIDPDMLFSSVLEKQQAIEKEQKATGDIGQWQEAIRLGAIPKETSFLEFTAMKKAAESTATNKMDELLSPSEAKDLGVKYGTTRGQAAAMGIDVSKVGQVDLTDKGGVYSKAASAIQWALPVTQQKTFSEQINKALESGDYDGAKNILKSVALQKAGQDTQNQLLGRNDAQTALLDIKKDLEEYKKAGGDTGFFKGNVEQIYNKIGRTTDPKLAAIQSRIINNLQKYRRSMTGVAFGAGESAEYAKLFPGIDKVEELNMALIDNLIESSKRTTDSFYSTQLGLTPDEYKKFENGPLGVDITKLKPLNTSYSSIDALVKANPDYGPVVDAIGKEHPEWTDDEIMQVLESPNLGNFNMESQTSSKGIVEKVASVPDNTKGGQCGRFVNKLTGLGVGDSYASKMAKMDPSIKTPEPGMVFTMPYKDIGHIGFIIDINDGIATVKDSNWFINSAPEEVRTHQIPISQMTGFKRINAV